MKIVIHDDEEKASDELQQNRKNICVNCENYNTEKDSCSECSCMITRRVYYLNINCPINKW
jgi:hypothetical protein